MTAGKESVPNTKQEKFYAIGSRVSKCDICKATKKTMLLSYGFSLCEDCINVCALILDQLQAAETNPQPKNKACKNDGSSPKLKINGEQTQ
jgi:hypothetical protein